MQMSRHRWLQKMTALTTWMALWDIKCEYQGHLGKCHNEIFKMHRAQKDSDRVHTGTGTPGKPGKMSQGKKMSKSQGNIRN